MLYIPQCVNDAVTSNSATTKLRVPRGACDHDTSGDWFPPGAPFTEHAFVPLLRMLSIVLIGSTPLSVKVVLLTRKWSSERSSPKTLAVPKIPRMRAQRPKHACVEYGAPLFASVFMLFPLFFDLPAVR